MGHRLGMEGDIAYKSTDHGMVAVALGGCHGLIFVYLLNSCVAVLTLLPQIVTLFGNRVIADGIS